MALEEVKEYFKTHNMEHRVLEFELSSATVKLASHAVGCEEAMIAKILAFMVDEEAILIVAPGDARIDNKKYKTRFRAKAKMLSSDRILELIGHGGGRNMSFSC